VAEAGRVVPREHRLDGFQTCQAALASAERLEVPDVRHPHRIGHHRVLAERVLSTMSATAAEAPASAGQATRGQGRWSSRWVTVVAGVALAGLIIGICLWTMLHEKTFIFDDWIMHQWYVWHQEGSLKAHGLPSLFAHDASGVFDPHFAFYGGTLYTISAVISLIVGHHIAFLITWVLAFAMAYGAWFWLARQAGLGPWLSHVPGALFITSTWYISAPYVLGSWAQTIAFGALLLILAAAFSILRADRLRPLPALALAVGTILYTGSHLLTLVWATTVLLIVGALAMAIIPSLRSLITRQGLLRLAVVAVPAVLVNAWFLLPVMAYQSDTVLASDATAAHTMLRNTIDGTTPHHLFSLSRTSLVPWYPRFAVQLPVLATAWVVAGLLIVRPRRSSPWLRAALLLLVAAVATWVLMTRGTLVLGLPHPYDKLQNLFRLEAYINLAIGGALIATLVLTRRAGPRRRWWVWVIAGILVVSVVQARQQARQPLPAGQLWLALPYRLSEPKHATADYADATVPLYTPDRPFKNVQFSQATAEREDRAEATVDAQPGDFVSSNLKVSPHLIHISGASIVARSDFGNAFLEIDADAKPGAAHIVVTTAHPWPVVLGRILTLLGLLGLAGIGVALLLRETRYRRSR
jgi:hypothetical protein